MEFEVSQKVRAAIKAKLVELGVHVDEELPDYIMVMVANGRSPVLMESDLKVFLGGQTRRFLRWLRNTLKKLEKVTPASTTSTVRKRKGNGVKGVNSSGDEGGKKKKQERSNSESEVQVTTKDTPENRDLSTMRSNLLKRKSKRKESNEETDKPESSSPWFPKQSRPANEKKDKATLRKEREEKLREFKLRNNPSRLGGPKVYYRKELNQQLAYTDGIFDPETSTGYFYNFYLEILLIALVFYVFMFFFIKYYVLYDVPSFDDPEALQEYKDVLNGVCPAPNFVHQRRQDCEYRDEL